MGRVGFVPRAGLWLSVTVLAALMTVGLARASGHTRTAWCGARQLTLSNAKGPHAIFGQAESTIWFLQIRDHGKSPCLVGAWLTLASARAVNGRRIRVRGVSDPGGFGGSPKAFALRPQARAFVELESGFPTAASRGCEPDVLLSFILPHAGGMLAVRIPREVGDLCPRTSLDISPTYDAAAFFQFMQELNAAPSRLPYARRAASDLD
jgi:hypothetical protein